MPRLQGKAESGPVALALGGLLALASAIGIGRFVYTPILPAMVEGLRMANSEAGLIASANLVGYLTGALLAAAPRLPGSRRTWLLGALALGAATTGAMGLVSSLPAFLALRGVGGAASAFVLVFASALVLDRLAAAGRGSLSSLHFAGVGVGITLSAVLVSSLLTAGADWRLLWLASGAAALATVPLVAWLVPGREAPRAAVTPASRPAGLAAASSMTRWTLAYGLFGFGYIVTATFLVAIVRASPGIRPVEPFVWVIVGIMAAPSVAAWAWLGTRIGISRAFAVACLVEAAGVAASVLWPTATGALMAAALLGGTFMGITALGLAGGRRLAGGDPRRAFALLTASFSVGQIAGPMLAGFLHDRTGGFVLPSLLAAGTLVVAAVLEIGVNMPMAIGGPGPATVDRSGG